MKYIQGFATVLLWVLVLLSFTANAFMLRLLVDARAQAAEALKLGAQAMSDLQAGTVSTTLRVDRTDPLQLLIPAGTVLPTSAGRIVLDEDVTFETNIQLSFDVPVELRVADTPLNGSLLSTKDFLERTYTQWQRDPLQSLLAPLPAAP